VWSLDRILAQIISGDETKALTPEMLPKLERAGKELAIAMTTELKKMLARSVEIDRAVVEGQTPHKLDEGVFRIGGLPSAALAHLLRIGHLTPEDVRWDDITGDPEGIKRLWPARETDTPVPVEPEPPPASTDAEGKAVDAAIETDGVEQQDETDKAKGQNDGYQAKRVRRALKERYPDGVPGRDVIGTSALRQQVIEDLKPEKREKGTRDPSWQTVDRVRGDC
jgi:hypothetical protein